MHQENKTHFSSIEFKEFAEFKNSFAYYSQDNMLSHHKKILEERFSNAESNIQEHFKNTIAIVQEVISKKENNQSLTRNEQLELLFAVRLWKLELLDIYFLLRFSVINLSNNKITRAFSSFIQILGLLQSHTPNLNKTKMVKFIQNDDINSSLVFPKLHLLQIMQQLEQLNEENMHVLTDKDSQSLAYIYDIMAVLAQNLPAPEILALQEQTGFINILLAASENTLQEIYNTLERLHKNRPPVPDGEPHSDLPIDSVSSVFKKYLKISDLMKLKQDNETKLHLLRDQETKCEKDIQPSIIKGTINL